MADHTTRSVVVRTYPAAARMAQGALFAGVLVALLAVATPALAFQDFADEPLLPELISDAPVEMHGRYAQQWRQADGTAVVIFSGGFHMSFGQRELSSVDAVVWLRSATESRSADNLRPPRKYLSLTVYLNGKARVREPGGTITEDSILLVSNLNTTGTVSKTHDTHTEEKGESLDLYARAMEDLALISGDGPAGAAPTTQVAGGSGGAPSVLRGSDAGIRDRDKAPQFIRFRFANVEPVTVEAGERSDQLYVATGGVYFGQTGTPDMAVLEITADNAVIFPGPSTNAGLFDEALLSVTPTPSESGAAPAAARNTGSPPGLNLPTAPASETGNEPYGVQGVEQRIEGVYLEGDVVLVLGERFIRADRLYYDFQEDRALILDAVYRMDIPGRDIPLYIRANEIRQLSSREFAARDAQITTSEFRSPHYHVGASQVYLRDRTVRDESGQPVDRARGEYELTDATLNVLGLPILYWPFTRGDIEESETLVRGFELSYSEDFGAQINTTWDLFNLMNIRRPPGYDARLELGYYSERGPLAGLDVDYKQEDYFGLARTFYIYDDGLDDLGPLRDNEPDDEHRGRILTRHKHFLPNDWELNLEFSWVSDPGFLEEYERSEWFEGKDQETVVYLKRAKEVDAITLLANWRLLEFVNQTEHLPEVTYRRIGDTALDPFVMYHESRVGNVRYRLDQRQYILTPQFSNDGESDSTFRADGRQEFELPLKFAGLGLNVVPFATFRASYWDGQPLDDGGLWRGFGMYGVRGSGYFSRVYDDIRSEMFDVDRIRHIIQPEFAAWWSHSNTRSELITPFEEGIETIDDFYGAMLGVRQIWQTKRGVGEYQRTTDLLTFNLEAGFFGDPQEDENSNGYINPIRPEDSRTENYVRGDVIWRVSDSTSLLYDFNFDLNDGSFDRQNLSIAIERLPRLSYVFGWRQANDIDLNFVGGGYNYRLNEKHITAFRVWVDADRGELGEMTIAYIRKLPRWYFSINLEIDEVFDDASITVSMWPEGIPEWTLGSRRFTGLSSTTGIRP